MTDRTSVTGQNQPDSTTPPVNLSSPSFLTMDPADVFPNYGLTIQMHTFSSTTALALLVQKSDGTPIFSVNPTESVVTGGRFASGAVQFPNIPFAGLDGGQSPPCLDFIDGIAQGQQMWSGTGAPSGTTVGAAKVGDWYIRRDTPSTANQRVYRCTAAGSPGTWSGIK